MVEVNEDRCPHCGSEDFDSPGPHTPRICLACGYDDEHGAVGVCPGGRHPLTRLRKRGPECCDDCYARVPRDLPQHQKWRSRLRTLNAQTWPSPAIRNEAEAIKAAVLAWLRDHPRETRNP